MGNITRFWLKRKKRLAKMEELRRPPEALQGVGWMDWAPNCNGLGAMPAATWEDGRV